MIDPELRGRVKITVIATGFDRVDSRAGNDHAEHDARGPARTTARGRRLSIDTAAIADVADDHAPPDRLAVACRWRWPPAPRIRPSRASKSRRRSTCRRSCAGSTKADPSASARRWRATARQSGLRARIRRSGFGEASRRPRSRAYGARWRDRRRSLKTRKHPARRQRRRRSRSLRIGTSRALAGAPPGLTS